MLWVSLLSMLSLLLSLVSFALCYLTLKRLEKH